MARKIVVTSGKGGVGKTTLTAHLGRKLAKSGKRVVLVDADFGLNNLDVVMGIENKVVYDMIDAIEGRCRAKQALVKDSEEFNLFVMPSAHSLQRSGVSGQSMRLVLDSLRNFDFILIDCPAGLDIGFHRAVSCADEAIVVVTPHISSIRDADKVIGVLQSYGLKKTGLVVNRARGDLMLDGEMLDKDQIASILKAPLIGLIPEDDSIIAGSNKSSPKDRAFRMLADNILLKSNRIFDCTKRYTGFFGSIRRSLRRKV